MSNKSINGQERTCAIKNAQTRERWEWFHRAITHAKQTNVAALDDAVPEPDSVRLLHIDSLRP